MRTGLLVTAALARAASASAGPCDADPEIATAVASKLTFETGHARLSDASKTAIEPVVRVMHAHPDLHIVVTGHAIDRRGGDIAKRRADVVKWYLVDTGITPDRIYTRVSDQAAASVIELGLSCAPAEPKAVRREDPKPAPHPDRRLDADHGITLTTRLTLELADAEDLANVFSGDSRGHGRRLGANLAQQISDARRRQQLTVGSATAASTQAMAPTAASVHALELTTPFERTGGEPRTRSRYGSARVTSVLPAPDTFTRKVTTVYMAGLAYCYRKGLAMNPGVSGRIEVSFAVDGAGATVEPVANGMDSDLDDCVREQMTRWRFAPTDEPTARFSVSLVLQPN